MTIGRRLGGQVAGALVMLAALPALSGCTPAPRVLIAVRAVDGEPVALLAGCPDFQIDDVSLYTRHHSVTATENGPDRILGRTAPTVPSALRLFGPPPSGWNVDVDDLAALEPGQSYGLGAGSSGSTAESIIFTVEDLATLAPDEVLAGKPRSHEKMTEREFREQAKGEC